MLTHSMVSGMMQYESRMLPGSVLGLPCMRRAGETIPKRVVQEEEEERQEIEIGQGIDVKAMLSMQDERQGSVLGLPWISWAGESIPIGMEQEAEAEEERQEIEIGQVIDVKAMLSSKDRDYLVSPKNGAIVPISSLEGKYLLVCSFTIPFSDCIIQSLEALYLYSEPWNARLLQIILLLDTHFDSYPSHFYSFFHSLSFNCLTIPLSDYKSCPRIRKSLPPLYCSNVSCLALHPTGRVLQNSSRFLYTYGPISFPFSQDNFDFIRHRELNLRFCLSNPAVLPSVTLEELLHCNSLPLLAHPNYFKPTSALYNKPVGLYLYYNGDYLHRFLHIHQQCLSKGLDFQFILVPLPFNTRHPDYFVTLMKQSVLESCPTSYWLTFPFNDTICRSLWRHYYCCRSDQLIVMPHAGRAGDLEARSIIKLYGIQSYPFTTDVIIEKKVTHLRSRTLESLLGDDHGLDICNKNFILYIVETRASRGYDSSHDNILKRKSHKIMKLYEGTQLYTVPLSVVSPPSLEKFGFKALPKEKWESVIDHIFMINDPLLTEMPQETVVTFGKDGKVLSRFKYDDIDDLTVASRFDDILSSQIKFEIQREIDAAEF